MDAWRQVWRVGLAPQISTAGLEALRSALIADDSRLIQGSTTTPPSMGVYVQDWPVESACALGYCGWKGEGLQTVGQIENYFSDLCYKADRESAECGSTKHFLEWFDCTGRVYVFRELLPEVERELSQRETDHVRS
jgi:hypothetical protein